MALGSQSQQCPPPPPWPISLSGEQVPLQCSLYLFEPLCLSQRLPFLPVLTVAESEARELACALVFQPFFMIFFHCLTMVTL